ncbi:eukaryotic translation initiation factor eIF1 [Linepithema humile]|uniref:eukaryotic translation initiation factor eIF1 n=1 Tax=Linepithema humile TaxID=83485 RepID=UPI00351E975E
MQLLLPAAYTAIALGFVDSFSAVSLHRSSLSFVAFCPTINTCAPQFYIIRGISFVCRMSIQNLNTFDPFADAIKGSDDDVQDGLVHIRIQQRNGRKTLTTVQGLSSEYDLKKIVRACKKEFACNGTVIEHPEYGEVLQLQGDQRENICQWLTKSGLAKPDQLKVHGF